MVTSCPVLCRSLILQAVSSAVFSASHQTSTASGAATETPSGAREAEPIPAPNSVGVGQVASDSSEIERQQEQHSPPFHARMLSEKPVDGHVEINISANIYESNNDGEAASTGQDRGSVGASVLSGSRERREHAGMGEEGARVEHLTKTASDETGPWAFAQAAADSVGGGEGGASKVIIIHIVLTINTTTVCCLVLLRRALAKVNCCSVLFTMVKTEV